MSAGLLVADGDRQREGLNPPVAVRQARDEYKSDMDLLAEWVDECCEVGDFETKTGDLWASWEAFAKARGELRFIPSSRILTRRLSARFDARKSNGKSLLAGVRVRTIEF